MVRGDSIALNPADRPFYSSGLELRQSFSLQLSGMDWPFRTFN